MNKTVTSAILSKVRDEGVSVLQGSWQPQNSVEGCAYQDERLTVE